MAYLYDIELSNGDIAKECYFVGYLRPVKGGKHDVILYYMPYSVEVFNKGHEKISLNLENAKIVKIYDEESGEDLTQAFIDKLREVERLCGYSFPLPIWRKQVFMEQ